MKPRDFHSATVAVILSWTGVGLSHAADVTSTAAGDWSAAGVWSDAAAPSAANTYIMDGEILNTGATTGNVTKTATFAGGSLTINAGELQLKRETTGIFNLTVPAFTLAGGSLVCDGNIYNATWNVLSDLDFALDTTSTLFLKDGQFEMNANLNGALTGSGNVYLKSDRTDASDDRSILSVTTADNPFSGNWSVQGFDTGSFANLRASAANALGIGTVTLQDRGALIVNAANGIDSLTGVTLNHAAAKLALGAFAWTNPAASLTVTAGSANIGSASASIGSLSQAAGVINVAVGDSAPGSRLTVAGTADFTGGSIAISLLPFTPGIAYDVLTYGTLTGVPTVAVTGDTGRLSAAVAKGSGTNDKITVALTGTVGNLVWTGATSNDWNNNLTQNFTNGGTPDGFRSFDNVLFDDSSDFQAPALVGTLAAGTVTFFNSAKDYTLGGAGSLGGATALVKSGTGTLTIANTTPNTFSGTLTVNDGILVINSAQNFTGTVAITGGTLKAGIVSSLGTTAGETRVTGGGTLDVNGLNLGAEVVKITGTGFGGNGTIVNSGADQINALRFITLTGDAAIGGTTRWDIRNSPTATLDLAGFKLTKTGPNYVALVGTTVTNGDIDINAGTLAISTSTYLVGIGTITVNPGGTLEIAYGVSAPFVTRNVVMNGGTLTSVSGTNGAYSNLILAADTVFGGNTGTLTLEGNIGETGGPRGIIKTGTSTFVLTGANSYSGPTTVNGGTLSTKSARLADSSAVAIAAGAKLDLNFPGSDQIAVLTLGGVAQGAGTYNAITSPDFITGTGSLVVGGSDPYAGWINGYFPGETNQAIIAKTADPDGDGVANGIEYLTAGIPNRNSDKGWLWIGTNDNNLVLSLAIRGEATTFTGIPSPSAMVDGITASIEGSTALGAFGSPVFGISFVQPVAWPASPPAGFSYHSFRLEASSGLHGIGFLRLKAAY